MQTGVYKITSPSGKMYIGSAINFNTRWKSHLGRLRNSKHHSRALQSAYKKYGEGNLIFNIILFCSKENLIMYEQLAIDNFKPTYNMSPTAGSVLGVKHTEEMKLSNSLKQKIAQNKPERLAENSRQQKVSQMQQHVRLAKAGRAVKCVETNTIFSCGHEAAEWCISQGLTTNKNAFVWINHSIRDKRTAYGFTFINYQGDLKCVN